MPIDAIGLMHEMNAVLLEGYKSHGTWDCKAGGHMAMAAPT
jgi:hypothetical protein